MLPNPNRFNFLPLLLRAIVRYTIYLAHLAPCPGGQYTCEAHILGAIMLVRPLQGESGVGGYYTHLYKSPPSRPFPL